MLPQICFDGFSLFPTGTELLGQQGALLCQGLMHSDTFPLLYLLRAIPEYDFEVIYIAHRAGFGLFVKGAISVILVCTYEQIVKNVLLFMLP